MQHDLHEVGQEHLLAEFHVVEAVIKKLPREIKNDFVKAMAEAEGDGGTNLATGAAWKRHKILAIFVEKQIRISREALRYLEDTSLTTPKDIRCFGCK